MSKSYDEGGSTLDGLRRRVGDSRPISGTSTAEPWEAGCGDDRRIRSLRSANDSRLKEYGYDCIGRILQRSILLLARVYAACMETSS